MNRSKSASQNRRRSAYHLTQNNQAPTGNIPQFSEDFKATNAGHDQEPRDPKFPAWDSCVKREDFPTRQATEISTEVPPYNPKFPETYVERKPSSEVTDGAAKFATTAYVLKI